MISKMKLINVLIISNVLFLTNNVASQEFPKNPFQTDSLYSKLKVRVVKEYTVMSLVSNYNMNISTVYKLNHLGQPISSKMVVETANKRVVSKSGEYFYEKNKLKRYNSIKEGKIKEFLICDYNDKNQLVKSELFNQNAEICHESYR